MIGNEKLKKRAKDIYEKETSVKVEVARRIGVTESCIRVWVKAGKWKPCEQRVGKPMGKLDPILPTDNYDRYNPEKGTAEFGRLVSVKPRTAEEIEKLLELDLTKWKLSNFWNKEQTNGKWMVSALCTKLQGVERVSEDFMEFLKTYKYKAPARIRKVPSKNRMESCLIFNKQDAHLNKHDIHGKNNIEDRCRNIEDKLELILRRASAVHNIVKGVYVLGSDLLNSEWTDMTTAGTPQQNVCSYHEGFEICCNHEVSMIQLLLQYVDDLQIIFVPGNHDKFVGWHVVNWLSAYFKDQLNLTINMDPSSTKYMRFDNSGMMFNHGDKIKPEKLALVFPQEFRTEWNLCEHYYIFTGDKHHLIAKEIGGIMFYQLPALSRAVSYWDESNAHTLSHSRMTGFLLSEGTGMCDTYSEMI